MTIELSLLLSGVSVAAAVFFAVRGNQRAEQNEIKQDATEMTTIIVKLENIDKGVCNLQMELERTRGEIKEDHDKLIRIDSSVKALWKQFDKLQQNETE